MTISRTSSDRLLAAAKAVSMVAALALVAQSEWELALAVGWPPAIAWAAAVALDAYVLAAVRSHRDLGVSVLVSAVSVLASHSVYAAPAVWVGGVPGAGGAHLMWQLAAGCSVVPLLVTWRIHHLTGGSGVDTAREAPVRSPEQPPPPPLPEAATEPVPEPARAPEPAQVAAAEARRDTVDAVITDAPTRRSRRDDAQWWADLDDAVRDGRLDPTPTADAIREAIHCGLPRARAMRDRILAEQGRIR
jgi:hypothetical protein